MNTKQDNLFYVKAMAVFTIVLGWVWGLEINGAFSFMPMHEFFMPGVLVVGGLLVLLKAMTMNTKSKDL